MNQAVNTTQAVRDYLKVQPAATRKEIVTALRKQGIEITASYVDTIKANTAVATTTTAPQETLTREQIKMVANAIKRIRSRGVAFRG
jgi:hypothetical protein